MATDVVLSELDAEIEILEADLRKAKEMRAWWVRRHPSGRVDAGPLPTARLKKNLPDYVRQVFRDGKPRLSREIVAEAQALGWTTKSQRPDQLVRNALRDMGDEVTVKDRYYSLVAQEGVISELFGDLVEPGMGSATG